MFSSGGLISTLHLNSSNIFFSGPAFWKIYWSVGLTASMWNDGAQRTGTFLLNLSLRKMCSKVLTLFVLTYEFFWQCSIGNWIVLKHGRKTKVMFSNFLFNLKQHSEIFSGLGIFGKNVRTACYRQMRLCLFLWRTCFSIRLLDGKIIIEYTCHSQNACGLITLINKFKRMLNTIENDMGATEVPP